MSILAERLLATHDALSDAGIPHAFGGAIALAYCTQEPRGTRDLDINVFVEPERADDVLRAMPDGVQVGPADVERAQRDGQVRVWWSDTPLDLFFDVAEFHREVAANVEMVAFDGRTIPVLGCGALVVFKVLFNRTRDWADIEGIIESGSVDCRDAVAWVERLTGRGSDVAGRLADLCR